jgi:hypothetical protein
MVLFNTVATTLRDEDEGNLIQHSWAPALSTAADAPPTLKPSTSYVATLSRPAFFKSRQPYIPPPAPPPPTITGALPPPPTDPGFTLGGVILSATVKKAYVLKKNTNRGEWLIEGGTADGWEVEQIADGRAVLRKDGRILELLLYPTLGETVLDLTTRR